MKAKVGCVVTLVIFMVITCTATISAQSQSKEQLIEFYESCILKKISNCQSKTILKTSRSVNLQKKADLANKQVIFFTAHKNTLINEMFDQGIGHKRYKVEYYLNTRFFELNQ